MASVLHNTIQSFGLNRGIEFNEAFALAPTRTGTSTLGTYVTNATNLPTYSSTGGPNGGAGYWRFTPTISASTTTWFSCTTSANTTEGEGFDDEDYSAGFWFNLESLPTGTSAAALRLFSVSSTSTVGFAVNITGSGHATPNRVYIQTGGAAQYSGSALSANTWYYVAVRRVGSTGNNYFAYLNGTQFGNWGSTNLATVSAIDFSLRSTAMPSATPFKISNFYVTSSSAIGPSQITQIWNAGNNVPSDLWSYVNTFNIHRGLEFNETPSATPSFTGTAVRGTWEMSTTAIGQTEPTLSADGPTGGSSGSWLFPQDTAATGTAYFRTNSASEISTIDSAYTFAFWFKVPTLPSGTSGFAMTLVTDDGSASLPGIYITGQSHTANSVTGSKVRIAHWNGTSYENYYSAAILPDTWYQVAVIRSGSTGTTYNYVLNKTVFGTSTITATGSDNYHQFGSLPVANTTADFKLSNWYLADYATMSLGDVRDIYDIGSPVVPVPVNYSADPMLATDAQMIDPVVSAAQEAQIFPEAMTSSSEFVYPALSLDVVLDAFGYGEASADSVNPTVSVESNVDIAADPQTASAEFLDATATATSEVNFTAGLLEASALLSNDVYAGRTVQDTSYNIHIRSIDASTNNTGNNGFTISANNGTVTQGLYIRTNTGFPTPRAELKKVKFNSAHVTAVSTNDVAPYNTFKVYKFDADTSGVYTTMTLGTLPSKTYLYTTRLADDGANPQFYLDLTRAFIEDVNDYGIWLEIDTSVNTGSNDQTVFNGTNLNNQLLYILTSELVNINYNETAITASAEIVQPTLYLEQFINYSADPATSSALFVNPDIEVQVAGQYTAQEMNSTALMANATFVGEISYTPDHMEAFAQKPASTVSTTQTVNYSAEPSLADGYFHMPQYDIGENNSADHMDASALFVDPTLILIINFSANPMIATNAEMIQPAPLPALNATYTASAMLANASLSMPPAFESLFDDKYYSLLYPQHATPHPFSGSGAKSILKMFSDVNTTISLATPIASRYIQNNIPLAYEQGNPTVIGDGSQFYFSNNNNALGTTGSVTPGFFDPYNRKAVRWQNIQLTNDTTSYIYGFTTEFFIKTTKSDQIIAQGNWGSATGNQKRKQSFGLVDGRLFVMGIQWISGSFPDVHPDNYNTLDALSNVSMWDKVEGIKKIDDGQWHHIVLQGGFDGRIQFWIDGQLDIQKFDVQLIPVSSLGYNSTTSTYASDFYISAYSYDPFGFISEQEIDLHAFAAINYEPYKAEPMVATATATQNNRASGNRARALYLYWWPKGPGILKPKKNDTGYWGFFDEETFDPYLDTMDWEKQPPQQYYGWDIFPVDINGYYVSEMVKTEAYGGEQNIVSSTLGGSVGPLGSDTFPTFKTNTKGYFRDPITDARRYIDLVNDIDLSQFDAIFFANYPDQSGELDEYARNQSVDAYFGKIEKDLYEDFLKSLRGAMDTGISLYITNAQLAIDLGIVDRVEEVELLQDSSSVSDPYAPTIAPSSDYPVEGAAQWIDLHVNNRNRVRQLIPGLTDDASYIWTDVVYYRASDDVTGFGEPGRPSYRYEKRQNGLNVGDEFIFSNVSLDKYPQRYLATPLANIKAGKAVTTFGSTIRAGVTQITNPYANYATTIVLEPGDVLNGRQVVGKVFVNFTERLASQKAAESNDYGRVDLNQDYWINEAYESGAITEAKRDQLLNNSNNLNRKLENNVINQATYNKKSYWSNNADNILVQSQQLQGTDVEGKGGIQAADGKFAVTRINRSGVAATSTKTYSTTTFFSFKYSRSFETLTLDVPSILTRGFRWLSKREVPEGLIQRPTAVTADATMVNPIVVADKFAAINAQAMVASAKLPEAQGYPLTSVNNVSLPMTATATITPYVTRISAAPMTATAQFRENVAAITSSVDEIVVYINHTDPILYLREDIIK